MFSFLFESLPSSLSSDDDDDAFSKSNPSSESLSSFASLISDFLGLILSVFCCFLSLFFSADKNLIFGTPGKPKLSAYSFSGNAVRLNVVLSFCK